MDTEGAVVSNTKSSGALTELLPAVSLNCAIACFLPSAPRSPAITIKLTRPTDTSAAVTMCLTGCARGEPSRSNWTESPAATDGLNKITNVGIVAAVILSMLELPVSDASRFGVPPPGAVVSSMKLSEAAPVLPKASVWLATIVCTPSARPLGVKDHTPLASATTVVGIGLPSTVKFTAVLARPVPLIVALFEVMISVDVPVLNASLAVTCGATAKVTGLSKIAVVEGVEIGGTVIDVPTVPVAGTVSAA